MDIAYIENGMELSQVRSILNEVIAKLNAMKEVSTSYNDLDNRPAIDGIILTENSSMSDFDLKLSSLNNYSELREDVIAESRRVATQVAEQLSVDKLSNDYTSLSRLEYALNDTMIIAIANSKGEVLQTTLADFILYLKHAILKIDDQYLRVIH